MTSSEATAEGTALSIKVIDTKLSERFIELDPHGYCLITVNHESNEMIVQHFQNDIDDQGRAIDPKTGAVIGCDEKRKAEPANIFRGRSAKEIGIKLTEGDGKHPISRLDHALYLGRELQKAENCLINGTSYIQD